MPFALSRSSALRSAVLVAVLLPACGGSRFEFSSDAGSGAGGGSGSDAGGSSGAGSSDGGATNGGGKGNGGTTSSGGNGSGGKGTGGKGSGGSTNTGGSGNGGVTNSGGTTSSGGSGGKGNGGTTSSGGSNAGGVAQGGSGGTAHGGSGGTGGGKDCKTDTDCGTKEICGFPTKDGCAATGTCFPAPQGICDAISPGCACDNTTINVICNGLPSGYATKPLAHTGACGVTDTTFACGASLNCKTGAEYCRVSEGGACCNPPSYSCVALPAGCTATPTCACVKPLVTPAICSESNGAVTVTFQYP